MIAGEGSVHLLQQSGIRLVALFTYSDGGTLQNQPLGMAKNLVNLIDQHRNRDGRFYLFASPHAKDPDANDSFSCCELGLLSSLRRLIDVVIGECLFAFFLFGVSDRPLVMAGCDE